MKRGNTALKRGVAIAAAFTTAIAGAVLAAPAASAATLTAPTQIRSTPIGNAAVIDPATGALYDNAVGAAAATSFTYASSGVSTTTTGAVPNLTVGSNQAASSVQILVPSLGAAGTAWASGDSFTVKLDNGATFSGAPTATITEKPVVAASLTTLAGYENTTKLFGSFQVANPGTPVTTLTPYDGDVLVDYTDGLTTSVNTDGDTLTVKFAGADPNAADGDASANAYVLTISGINLNIAPTATYAAVTAALPGGNKTTIAYVSPYKLVTGTDAGYTVTSKDATGAVVALPDVTVRELSNAGFVNAQSFTVTATGDKAGTAAVGIKAGDTVTTKPSSKLVLNPTTGKFTSPAIATLGTLDAASANLQESFTTSGLNVQNLKQGAKVTLTLVPGALATVGDTATTWAHTTAQKSSGVTLEVGPTSIEPRVAGSNRYATAAKIAADLVAEGNGVNVVLANGTDLKLGIDALAANFLAGAEGNAPILLADSSDTLPSATVDALKAMFKDAAGSNNAVNIFVLGDTDSVSEKAAAAAETTVKDAVNAAVSKVNVVRVKGANRYETSAAAAVQAVKDVPGAVKSFNINGTSYKTAFLASGKVNADALAAGAFSAGAGIPVLLADGDTVNEKVAAAIDSLGIKQLIVLGGTDRVSQTAIDTLTADHGVKNVVRIAGSGSYGRYNTAALLNTFAFGTNADQLKIAAGGAVYLANGTDGFADALAVGPLAGKNKSALLTVPTSVLPDLAKQFLTVNKASWNSVTALGQSDRIAASVISAAQSALGIN